MIQLAQPIIGDDEVDAVSRVLRSGALAQGPEVAQFEAEFSSAVDGRACVAVNSGTSALHLLLLAFDIGPGDEVIVPSFSFAATANAVALTGATPVFADIDLESFCLDPEAAERVLSPRTKAVMPVHLYGHPADMPRLRQLCDTHGILLLEDAAQAHLAAVDSVPVGALGDGAAFSFYPTKNMTSGEGGMVVVADDEVARRVRLLRNQGMERRYENEVVGFNLRMTDVHAAIGRVQYRNLCEWTTTRRENAARLTEGLRGVFTPIERQGFRHVFHQYTIRVTGGDRDEFADALRSRGVQCGVYYPTPIHLLPSFSLDQDLPNTEIAAQTCLSIPVHPALSSVEIEAIIESVNAVAGELS